MRLYLIGYMGCGKSTIGRKIARFAHLDFVDTDSLIEQRENATVADVMTYHGEEYFRRLESRYLHEVCELYGDFILSCGGGTPCFNNNMDYMNSQGVTIFINPSIDTIVKRLIRGKWKRPLVAKLSDDEIRDYVEKHLAQRMPYYSQAQEQITNEEE